jgi:hypothetical protein
MKNKLIYKLTGMIFLIAAGFSMKSCEETKEILEDLTIFTFDYQFSNSTTSNSFLQETVSYAVGPSNQIDIYQSPSNNEEQLLIRMERNGLPDRRFVRAITIDVLGPPVSVGNVYTEDDGHLEVLTDAYTLANPPTYTTENIQNTFFTLEITSYNTITKKIGGTFEALVRYKDSPQDSAYINIENGSFTYDY